MLFLAVGAVAPIGGESLLPESLGRRRDADHLRPPHVLVGVEAGLQQASGPQMALHPFVPARPAPGKDPSTA